MWFPARAFTHALVLTAISGTVSLFAQQPDVLLPKPQLKGPLSVEEALATRRSLRAYTSAPFTLQQLSQILWAAQGLTSSDGKRTAPSAMHVYPLELYVGVARVAGLKAGVYRFVPQGHGLARLAEDANIGQCLMQAARGQPQIGQAAIVLVYAADSTRTARFGARAATWVGIEVGAAVQNVYLQSQALDFGTVAVGAADAAAIRKCLPLAPGHSPVLMQPVGAKS